MVTSVLLGGSLRLPVEKQCGDILGQETAIRTVQVKSTDEVKDGDNGQGMG